MTESSLETCFKIIENVWSAYFSEANLKKHETLLFKFVKDVARDMNSIALSHASDIFKARVSYNYGLVRYRQP